MCIPFQDDKKQSALIQGEGDKMRMTLCSYVRHSQQELHLDPLTIKDDGDLNKNIVCRFTSVGVLSSSLADRNSVGYKQPALTRVR